MSTHYTIPQDADTVHAGQTVPWDWVRGMIIDGYYDRTGNNTDLSPGRLLELVQVSSTQLGSDLMARSIVCELGFTGLSDEFIAECAHRIAEDAAGSIDEIKELAGL
jgi:hypothetical protein